MKPVSVPNPYSTSDTDRLLKRWLEYAPRQADPALGKWMEQAALGNNPAHSILLAIFGNSPFLSNLLLQHPQILEQSLSQDADTVHARLLGNMTANIGELLQAELMQRLRITKGKIALLVAIADIAGWWQLEKVTAVLSSFAELCLTNALNFLLSQSARRGDITLPNNESPSSMSGIIVLGMGKLGGRELNYSSDIDLIILFEAGRITYNGRHIEQKFMSKLAHDIVHIMQERTADGYVFRTDLRLRPDPASTPPAINTEAASYYYESVGQNWERAAMIKARPVAGDIDAGNLFIKNLAPFMWRRSLDFAAIQDIHSIKRQMDTHQGKKIHLKGHNIKLGQGGIREIEFYVQIQQLIWGGRFPALRTKGTCETIEKLFEMKLITEKIKNTLLTAYRYHRKLEHRLQMVADEQTHSLPADDSELLRIAYFMGYSNIENFMRDTTHELNQVHEIFANSFQSSEKLGVGGNLVFTGVSHDPDTLQTLRDMGYVNPETVSEIVMGWHHGSKRATRTKRARELLTEMMPTLLKRLSETVNPDMAFLKFNDFLTNLPAGVQLFSLFNINPQLLGLVADIMGSAPTLAEYLSKSPSLLDAVLYSDFYRKLPTRAQLEAELHESLPPAIDFEEHMEYLVRFRNEKQFQAGVHLLKRMIDAKQTGIFLADVADLLLSEALKLVSQEFERSHGKVQVSRIAIIALGKLGSRELTFGSDLDLVFVFDANEEAVSDGEKQLSASVYYNRLTQRMLNAVSSMGREGRLYEVDTRLRPSGGQGLLITSLGGLHKYFEEAAWTFEYMAFTKARPVAGDAGLVRELADFVNTIISKPRDNEKLKKDAIDMRNRIDKEFSTKNIWDIKYVRGGLIDSDFIAQYLLLLNSSPGKTTSGSTEGILKWLVENNYILQDVGRELITANQMLNELFHVLRLCSSGVLNEQTAMPGLKKLLCQALDEPDFQQMKQKLIGVEQAVLRHYISLLN